MCSWLFYEFSLRAQSRSEWMNISDLCMDREPSVVVNAWQFDRWKIFRIFHEVTKIVVDACCSAMDLSKMVLMSISYSFLLDAFVHWFASDRNWFVVGNATKEIRGECSRCSRRKLRALDIINEKWWLRLILRRKSETFWVIIFLNSF